MISVEDIRNEIQTRRRVKQFPRSIVEARKLALGKNPGTFAHLFARYTDQLRNLRFLSCGVSQTGNTYEIRVKSKEREVLRIASYHLENGGVACEVMDQLYDKLARLDLQPLFHYVSSSVVVGSPLQPPEFPSDRDFGTAVLGGLLLEDESTAFCIQTLTTELLQFHATGVGQERNRRHERTKAIDGMRPFVKRFLQNGGSYEDMVSLLETEVVASVQDT